MIFTAIDDAGATIPAGTQVVYREVTDTGTGIPDEVLPHILEPFFTTKTPSQGTGLGLSQAYGIIKQHQGYLVIDTKLEVGSSFFILLPLRGQKDNCCEALAKQSRRIKILRIIALNFTNKQ